MIVKVLGKYWRLEFTRLKTIRGSCDSPDTPKKSIRIASNLKDKEKLEVLIHEVIHAAGWNLCEEFVEQLAYDLSNILWRVGLRFDKHNSDSKK